LACREGGILIEMVSVISLELSSGICSLQADRRLAATSKKPGNSIRVIKFSFHFGMVNYGMVNQG